jgi:hypothetical protein
MIVNIKVNKCVINSKNHGRTMGKLTDVHKLSWRVNLRDDEWELKYFTQPADACLLHKHLSKNYPGATYKAGYEAGFCGFGIQGNNGPTGWQLLKRNKLKFLENVVVQHRSAT